MTQDSGTTQQKIVELPAGSAAYRQWGAGDAVICLHGLADYGLVWQSLGGSLRQSYCCLAPDLPGHGNSFKPVGPDAYASSSLVSVLEDFANVLRLQRLHVLAHSWSAKLALMWARRSPSRVASLILIDPFFVNRFPGVLKPSLPLLYRLLPFLRMMGPFSTLDQAEATARNLKQYRGWSPLQRDVFTNSIERRGDGTWGSKFAIAARNGVFLDTFQQSGLSDTVQTPTHILIPDRGLNQTSWQLKPYVKFLPQLTISHIPGNHWPHLVEPQALNRAVLDALRLNSI